MSGNVWLKSGTVRNLFPQPGVTTTATGTAEYKDSPNSTYQAIVAGTGAVTATVVIEVTNDPRANSDPANAAWVSTVLGTITLSGTTTASDGFTTNAPWKYVRARVTAISGTGATVQVYMGV
jgi:hypothetical protein